MSYNDHPTEFQNGRYAMSQETINRALADSGRDAHGNIIYAASSRTAPSHTQSTHSNDPSPGNLPRKNTATRRDPITGDLIEEYVGGEEGPEMRAHYNWDDPGQAPNTTGGQYASGGTYGAPQSTNSQPRPGEVRRTNTTISYDSSGNRIEEHDGEGSLQVRALWNDDEDTSGVYNPNSGPRPRPQGPPRHQSGY